MRSENIIGQLNRLGFNDLDVCKASLFDQLQVISVRQGARNAADVESPFFRYEQSPPQPGRLSVCAILFCTRDNAGSNLMEYE